MTTAGQICNMLSNINGDWKLGYEGSECAAAFGLFLQDPGDVSRLGCARRKVWVKVGSPECGSCGQHL